MSRRLSIIHALVVSCVATAALATPLTGPTFLLTWGSNGGAPGQFQLPHGLCYSPVADRVYVADTGNHRVQMFTPHGGYLGQFGSYGSGSGSFMAPGEIAVDAQGNVYVASDHRVQKFAANGAFLAAWGGMGTEDGKFQYVMDVAVDADGAVYATDWMNYRVQKFTADGTFVKKWGSQGTGDGQFGGVITVECGPDGRVYVADAFNHRVQVFTAEGEFVSAFGAAGSGEGQLDFPNSPGSDAQYLYVADPGNHRIAVFRLDGTFVLQWGTLGDEPGEFFRPSSVSVAPDGSVFVADKDNYRVQKFAPLATPVRRATWGAIKDTYR